MLDLWDTAPAAPVSFDAREAPEPLSRWSLDLPHDPQAAEQRLALHEAQVEAVGAQLALVPQKLDRLLQARRSAQTGGVAFVAAGTPALAPSEAELWHWLDQVQGPSGAVPAPVSYDAAVAAEAARGPGWEEAARQCAAGVERLERLLTQAAWVETRVVGQLLGQTLVSWTGDTRTAWGWGGALERPAWQWHRRSLALALATRTALLRTFFIVTQNTVKLSVLLAVPGGAALALPVAWRFVHQVLAELDEYQKFTHSEGE